MSTNP